MVNYYLTRITMVSITPFSKNALHKCYAQCVNILLRVLLVLSCASVWAADGEIKTQRVSAAWGDNQVELALAYKTTLTPALEDALTNGLSLPFVYEFELTRPRSYALYKQVMTWFSPTATLTYRLSYHALSRQYRLHLGSFYRSFNSLADALAAMGVVRDWGVLQDTNIAKNKNEFLGRVRLKLDLAQLPKTWQLAAFGHSDWQLDSDW